MYEDYITICLVFFLFVLVCLFLCARVRMCTDECVSFFFSLTLCMFVSFSIIFLFSLLKIKKIMKTHIYRKHILFMEENFYWKLWESIIYDMSISIWSPILSFVYVILPFFIMSEQVMCTKINIINEIIIIRDTLDQ